MFGKKREGGFSFVSVFGGKIDGIHSFKSLAFVGTALACLLFVPTAGYAMIPASEIGGFTFTTSHYFLLASTILLLVAIMRLFAYRRHLEIKTHELASANAQLRKETEERSRIQAALEETNERYALVVRGANDGIWDWNFHTNRVYFSDRWKSMLGYGENEIGTSVHEWFQRVHREDIHKLEKDLSDHLDGATPHFENEHRLLTKEGEYLWVLSRGIAIKDSQGHPLRIAGSLTDISNRKKTEEQLIHNAFYDPLTGLPNRALFMDRLRMAFAHQKRNKGYLFAILFLDLDRFKNINDSFGHLMGDELLIHVAKKLQAHIRPDDTIARFGGDEFVILLSDIRDEQDAALIAQRINAIFRDPFHLNEFELYVSVSIGIANSNHQYQQPEDILRDADTALYTAKSRGKSCCVVFDHSMHVNALDRLELEIDLRHAIDRGEFILFYQPIIHLEDRRTIGFEALVRWRHPRRGLLMPLEFIPLAEETGLIIPLSVWIIREACRQLRSWQEKYGSEKSLLVSVNISPLHLKYSGFVDQIKNILKETRLHPEHLAVEITENFMLENSADVTTVLTQLQELGVKIYIDDFGTGFSSLSYVQRFPINTLKIDRSFIDRLSASNKTVEIVQSIITMARNMNLHIIAEGVEDLDNLQELQNLKCESAQGFLFSQPVDIVEAEKFLMEQSGYTEKAGFAPR